MWKVYKYDGHYIQGEFISQHKTESAALKKAEKTIGHKRETKMKRKSELLIWLDAEDGTPMGVIIKKHSKGGAKVSTE